MPLSRTLLAGVVFAATAAHAQTTLHDECRVSALQVCTRHVLEDEAAIITSPLRFTPLDWVLVVPFGVATGIALENDVSITRKLGVDPSREQQFNRVSDLGTYGVVAAAVAGYATGAVTHNDHLRRSAVVAGEAMLDATLLNEGLKYAINRQDPKQGDGTGRFWPHGTRTWPDGQSMPSEHSINAWAFAHAVATQYPGWGTKLLVYSMASTVSASRVVARDHFTSDVVVGSALGYLIGGFVGRHRGDGIASNFSIAPVRTPNGRGMELSYSFSGNRPPTGE